MTTYLTINQDVLETKKAYWTAREIEQQPRVWREAQKNIADNKSAIEQFISPLLKLANLRIILTGAGTSAYIGDALAPHLSKVTGRLFEAVSTTNIVSNPTDYLLADIPTLLISYGRSGNSPESVAAVDLANEVVKDCYHLVITCNPEGELVQSAATNDKAFSLLMPYGTLDESFAMTSSFTSMLVSTLCVFAPNDIQLEKTAQWTEHLLANEVENIKAKAKIPCERLVFLGSGPLLGFAREAALKCLELTSGKVLSYCESPLGFRHGPKSLVDSTTEIILFASSNRYSAKYDTDLYAELVNDNAAINLTKLDASTSVESTIDEDVWAGLGYIVYAQVLSFFKSIDLDISPDNPCPTGEVNRVVQGVTIYPLAS